MALADIGFEAPKNLGLTAVTDCPKVTKSSVCRRLEALGQRHESGECDRHCRLASDRNCPTYLWPISSGPVITAKTLRHQAERGVLVKRGVLVTRVFPR
jgi:hypothetical protein